MNTMLVYGDSISADTYTLNGVTQRSGFYKRQVAASAGLSLVGEPGASVSGYALQEGATADADFAARVTPYAPDVLLVTLGTNNFYQMGTLMDLNGWSDAQSHLWYNVSTLAKRPSVFILALLPTIRGAGWVYSYGDEWLIAEMNHYSRNIAYANGGKFVEMEGFDKGMVRTDGHPDVYGHGFITGRVLDTMGVR